MGYWIVDNNVIMAWMVKIDFVLAVSFPQNTESPAKNTRFSRHLFMLPPAKTLSVVREYVIRLMFLHVEVSYPRCST
jgi:hypothetical protein